MKIVFALLFCGVLPVAFPAARCQAQQSITPIVKAGRDKNAEAAGQRVLDFLNWYKNNFEAISQIRLVNQVKGKAYTVDFQGSERYLAFLKTSNLLSNSYLNEWRLYFTQRDEGFRLSRQTDGIPTGFEYDLVLLTQAPKTQLESLNKLKIRRLAASGEKATVQLWLVDEYEFRLVKKGSRWVINDILNLSQE